MSDPETLAADGSALSAALRALPLLGDDIYLGMQATNIGMVDDALMEMEADLLREYFQDDATPLPSAAFLSALTQLWIFGVYELLRTWRQRVRRVLQLAAAEDVRNRPIVKPETSVNEEEDSVPYPERASSVDAALSRVASDASAVIALRNADDHVNSLFKRLEALRVHLAKHEVPKMSGSVAFSPGYGRINTDNGSIYYQFEVRPPQVDVLSRRDIADACRELVADRRGAMLPESIRRQIERFPEFGYGAKRVRVTLRDGSCFDEVFVLWNREIASVGLNDTQPFDAGDVVDVSPHE